MFYHLGPPLHDGPLPAIFYFALSSQESLFVDPFNQPVEVWKNYPVRIFSVDLPFHGEGQAATKAMDRWAEAFLAGQDPLTPFFLELQRSIRELFATGMITKAAASGLSRGGFVASHIAASFEEISTLMLFAPLTDLASIKEFSPSPLVNTYLLSHLKKLLSQKKIRIHIGNRDLRVGTDSCYQFFTSLVEQAFSSGVRSPPFELLLTPSIGHLGHGTSSQSFTEGALWLIKHLL